jgi:2-phosphosulfolactate phosphatase
MTNREKPSLEVCLSPALLHLYNTRDAVVVIIDVFRATSTITAALHNGAKCVIPVASVEECIALGERTPNSITAGERDGKIAAGLQYGNSPTEYPEAFIKGKTLILTTTNGTRLLHMVSGASTIAIGSFLNLDALAAYLLLQKKNVILGCASWKDRFNLEDTLFAGAVVGRIQHAFEVNCDSARAAKHLCDRSGDDYLSFLKDSSHYRRLSAYGLEADMAYCATPNLHPVVPILKGREILSTASIGSLS